MLAHRAGTSTDAIPFKFDPSSNLVPSQSSPAIAHDELSGQPLRLLSFHPHLLTSSSYPLEPTNTTTASANALASRRRRGNHAEEDANGLPIL
jgi:hypothetical protein